MKSTEARSYGAPFQPMVPSARPTAPAHPDGMWIDPRVRANLGHPPVRILKWVTLAAAIAWASAALVAIL